MKKRFEVVGAILVTISVIMAIMLSSCGGGSESTGNSSNSSFIIGGTVSGLSGTLVLQNNGVDDLSVTANGPFTFVTTRINGASYSVSIKTQPFGQTCAVSNGTGTINGANVTNVAVACSTNGTNNTTYSVGGTVSSLSGTLVLQNNGADDLSIMANGAFSFATLMAAAASYNVSIKTQPSGQTCTVSNGTGTINGANVTNVTVTCTTNDPTYSVGGVTVDGLSGTLVLRNIGADDLSIIANGTFVFATPVANGAAYTVTVKTQPTGKTCLISNGTGTINGGNVTNVSVACGTPGSLDTTFGGTGKVITSASTETTRTNYAYAVALQKDNKVIAVGRADMGVGLGSFNEDFAVLRYNTDGSLDTSFGGTGIVTTNVGGFIDYAWDVTLQEDGEIIVSGGDGLVRYNSDGSLDTTFGGGTGKIIDSGIRAVAIQSDDKIVVAGGNSDFVLWRLNVNGSLDTTFCGTGKVTTSVSSGQEMVASIVIQNDGKIVAAGLLGGSDIVLARYNADGSLDTTFNGSGVVTTSIQGSVGGSNMPHTVAIQNDGKLVVAGKFSNGTNDDFAIVRYNLNGSIDSTFGLSGKVTTAIGNAGACAYAVTIQNDGKIVAAGYSSLGSVLVRYTADGSLDTSFGGTGSVTGNAFLFFDVAIQGDGKLVAVGSSNSSDFVTVRYWP